METKITTDKLLEQIDALCESGAEAMPDGERLTALIVRSRLLAERYRQDNTNGYKVKCYNDGLETAVEHLRGRAAYMTAALTEENGFAYWIAKAKETLLDEVADDLEAFYMEFPK